MGNAQITNNHDGLSSSASSRTASDGSQETSETSDLRRSQRERSATTIRVGPYTVRKENNYVLEGTSYKYGVAKETDIISIKRPATVGFKDANTKKPRRISAAEQQRLTGRKNLQEAIERKAPLRLRFLREHADVLEPFGGLVRNSTILDEDHGEFHHTNCNQPDCIQGDLRDYQLAGLNWMAEMHAKGVGFILGDEMGLGKTLQTISLICHLKESSSNMNVSPNLIVCPLSVLESWVKEIKMFSPSLKYKLYHTSNTEQRDTANFHSFDVVISTYEMIKAPALKHMWQRQAFQLVVLDEGHKIKCLQTQTSQAVRSIKSENRVILTGTPVANNLAEVFSLLNYLLPDVFVDPTPFEEAFDLLHNQVDSKKLSDAHKLIKVFMLRRLKSEVEALMPKKIETKIYCPLSNKQLWWYKALLLKDIGLLSNGSSRNVKVLNNLIMQLRKVCIHPYLFPDVEEDQGSLEDLVGASGKLAVLDMLLCSLYKNNHRIVLFSQFTTVLDIIQDYCERREWHFCRFDGSTSRAERNFVINSFNDGNKFIFLMSTRSGGMGLNLQTADTCILFDSDWNPQPDVQAMARVHRIGQKKTVHVYRLVTEGTVEDRMVKRAEKKLYLDRMVTQDGAHVEEAIEEDCDRLVSTLKFGCNAVFGQNTKDNVLPTEEDIEIITDRSRTEDFSQGKLQGSADECTTTFDATRDFAATTDFAGIDFEKLRKKYHKQEMRSVAAVGSSWSRKKRERKTRIRMVDVEGTEYGSKSIPVLACNTYALERESDCVSDTADSSEKKRVECSHEMQDWCQICGDGGELVGCPFCPVSVHLECAGICHAHEFRKCSHHMCSVCEKDTSRAGGFLYACHSCPNAYCEDHIPEGYQVMEKNEQMEELNYQIKHGVYILCCKQCEEVAREDFGWTPPVNRRQPCPSSLHLDSHFGGLVDDR